MIFHIQNYYFEDFTYEFLVSEKYNCYLIRILTRKKMAKYFFKYYFSNKFPDQWSPLNTEGKKQYGRDLLMALAKDPLSVRKPENLPSMDIIKDSINPRAGPGISGLPHIQSKDWTPGFVKKN